MFTLNYTGFLFAVWYILRRTKNIFKENRNVGGKRREGGEKENGKEYSLGDVSFEQKIKKKEKWYER